MGDPRLAIARRELSVLRREKTIVLAIAIQLFIAAFSSFLAVGFVSLYDPGSIEGGSVDLAVTGEAADDLARTAAAAETIEATPYDSPRGARIAFRNGRVDAVLETRRPAGGPTHVRATLPDGNVRTTLVVVQLRDTLRAYERTERERLADRLEFQPLPVPPERRSNPYYGFTYTVLIPLLAFLPVFVSGSIAVDSITEELDRGTLELLRVAPISLQGIVDGKFAAIALLAPAQVLVWIGLLEFNGTTVANVPALIGLVAAFASLVTALGVAVSLFVPDRRIAQPVYSACVIAFVGATASIANGPINATARLAIDSAGPGTIAAVAGYAALGIGAYLATRRAIGRLDPATL